MTSSISEPRQIRWTRQDVKELKNVPVDQMLKEILVDCGKPGQSFDEDAKTSLFTECLRKVLPFCNGKGEAKLIEAKPIEGTKNKKREVKSSQIKSNLKKYSALSKAHEKELYPPFVKAANTAFLFLQELEVECLRGANDLICFQVLDPSRLQQEHKTSTSERKPDVIVVSETDIRIPEGGFLFDVTAKPPGTPFEWRDVRMFVEFKQTTSKVKMDPPPKSYSYQSYTTPTPEYLGLLGHGPRSRQLKKVTETDSRGRKWTSSNLTLSESERKHQKSNPQKKDQDPIVQAGDHAAELFSTHAGRLHVFGLIIVGDILYLWRYDREGAIQCSGFNFIQDLPRFLVLLLAMQRFNNRDWGLNPHIDPDFGEPHETTLTDGAKDKQIKLTLELSDEHRVTHFGLNGRATNVFSVKCSDLSNEDDLVAKVSWPHVARTSEPTILERVDDIAKDDDDVKGHVPQMLLWYRKFEDTSTAHIRKRLGLDVIPQSSRVLYIIVFRRLRPIRELVGHDFLRAWWATVKCHLALWKKGVYHRDISDSNLMYYKDEGNIVGVLNDFDLATTKDTPSNCQRHPTNWYAAIHGIGAP